MNLSGDPDVRRAYARDVSGLELIPDVVARPNSADDVVELVRRAVADRIHITPAGSQTSTTGASITDTGVLLSMGAMSRILDVDPENRTARVQPGVTIGALNTRLAELGLRFAPDPTSENDATIGGAIACNASGARSLRYGPTRGHVRAVELVNGAGDLVHLRRPQLEKNTVGFFAAQDQVDWIVGSEGTLGVIVEAELALVALPAHEFGLAVPFQLEQDALAFVAAARERGDRHTGPRPQCLEFFDGEALGIARASVDANWMRDAGALVYLEQAVEHDASVDNALDAWLAFAQSFDVDAADISAYDDAAALRDARRFRHAVPAHMNDRGSARRAFGGRKVSTDWAVPYRELANAIAGARRIADAHGVEQAVTYGHAGNGHPHQNFIAADADDLARINGVVDETIHMVLAMGGTVSAEHGLGKLKRHWLETQLSPMQIAVMRAMKNALDPLGIFSPGNLSVSRASTPAFATVVLDVDSTVSGIEGIDWLAARRGDAVAVRIAALTDQAMRGELPLEAVYGARLAAIRPTQADVDALARAYVDGIAPECKATIERLRRAGVRVILVSGGVRNAMARLAEHLGFDAGDVHAVDIRFGDDGAYVGFDERSPLTTALGKATVIRGLALTAPVLMVGDGATDLAARGAVDQFAAFTGFVARAAVVSEADVVLSSWTALAAYVLQRV